MKTKLILLLSLTAPVQAADMYKCTVGGITSYQHTPCQGAAEQSVIKEKKLNKEEIDAVEEYKNGITVGPLYIQKSEDPTSEYQDFSYKASVINNTESDRKMNLTYKGLDSNGFVVKEITLKGTVPAHSSKELTDKRSFDINQFDAIKKWVLDK